MKLHRGKRWHGSRASYTPPTQEAQEARQKRKELIGKLGILFKPEREPPPEEVRETIQAVKPDVSAEQLDSLVRAVYRSRKFHFDYEEFLRELFAEYDENVADAQASEK
jgi:hypothetical protein